MRSFWSSLLPVALVAGAGCAAAPAAAPAPAAPAVGPVAAQPTLIGFLGIQEACTCLANGLQHKFQTLTQLFPVLGTNFAALEHGPPILPLTAAANLEESAPPAVQVAAQVKQDEELAAQKIKAIRYLAGIGCTSGYPEIKEALLLALDDPTEAVRFEAAKAIRETAQSACVTCNGGQCCTPEIREKLERIANELDFRGCPVEPSARVRRMARVALDACGPSPPIVVPPDPVPIEGPLPPPPSTDLEGPIPEAMERLLLENAA